jgi:hypothetical protein
LWKRPHHLLPVRGVEALVLESLLLALQRLELLGDVRVDEIGDVLAVVELWHDVVFPRIVGEDVVLCVMLARGFTPSTPFTPRPEVGCKTGVKVVPRTLGVGREDAHAGMFEVLFLVPFEFSPVRVLLVVLDPRLDRIRDERRPLYIISLLRDRDVDLVGDRLDARSASHATLRTLTTPSSE